MPVQIPTPKDIIRKVNLGFMPFVSFKENVSVGAGARLHGGRRLPLPLAVPVAVVCHCCCCFAVGRQGVHARH